MNGYAEESIPKRVSQVRGSILIAALKAEEESLVADMIRRNLAPFEEAGSILVSSFRRLESFFDSYQAEGCRYLVARNAQTGLLCGGVGLGPLQGLSRQEGYAELRELVIEPRYRSLGLGHNLLKAAVDEAHTMGYERAYLATTNGMERARRLFTKAGFRPISEPQGIKGKKSPRAPVLPCYFLLENLRAPVRT